MPAQPPESGYDIDGEPLLREEAAAVYLGRAVRKMRKLGLPFEQPPGTRRKDQRLYRLDLLTAWRDEHGTWRDDVAEAARRTHTKLLYLGAAYSTHPHYDRWRQMKQRCYNPDHRDYPNYGGRGVQVYEPWIDDPIAFFRYLDAYGEVPDGYSLDRIDNDGHYVPGNLQLVDARTQNQNRREWADLDDFAPCCWCIACEHDSVTCPIEALDWTTSRLVLGTPTSAPFDHRKARRDYGRASRSSAIVLPIPRPDTPSAVDEIMALAELDRFVREALHD